MTKASHELAEAVARGEALPRYLWRRRRRKRKREGVVGTREREALSSQVKTPERELQQTRCRHSCKALQCLPLNQSQKNPE